ncbi:excisionase family DNA binding protein [Xanthobacter flavus]|uniref:Excisionase family DNA binding protein n=1 Tax=Xanthobacter flavus TaxID=281 RepID=A0A9W6CPR2_XANFL|nr:excisionase family DNA-binding protein [Xanthobacter flavus]MDR6332581.1 excisionase family DNA binding protein [Xanthobacter flavus]GLI21668.1 hypothetical protein XFLAVUS301_13420 [Xanthobacter flavus]
MSHIAHTELESKNSTPQKGNAHDDDALSITGAAKRSSVSDSTVKRAIRDGKLKAKKFGRRTLILRADFNEWLHGLPAA